jgi:hypothetical protein
MTTVTHAVGDMDAWLKGGEDRKALFSTFCSNYRIFRQDETNRVAIVGENVDLAKVQAAVGSAESAKAKAAHTIIDPLDIFIEIAGGK